MSDVFISYQHGDRGFVEALDQNLRGAGFTTWYDKRIAPGAMFNTAIVDNLLRCHCVIAVASRSALQSAWVSFEWILGARLDKSMLVVILNPEEVRPHDLPDELRPIHVLELGDPSSTSEVISAVGALDLPPRIWSVFSETGFDIYLPREKFTKPEDSAVGVIEGVNLRAINVAMSLQDGLIERFGPLERKGDAIHIHFLPDSGLALPVDRSHIILGGPGGVPYVHTLLRKWADLERPESPLTSGYRFVTNPRRPSVSGPFLRPANRDGLLLRHVGPIGIEDVKAHRVIRMFEYREAHPASAGRNYVVVYTAGLDDLASATGKTVILAAFNRQVLDGAIGFLLNRQVNNYWLAQVQRCGAFTETLLEFDVNVGAPPVLQRVHEPRRLGP